MVLGARASDPWSHHLESCKRATTLYRKMPKSPKKPPPRKPPPDLTREPPKPKTDDPSKDKSGMEDGVLQPLPAAD